MLWLNVPGARMAFQFHSGSIKRASSFFGKLPFSSSFNSIVVRLKGMGRRYRERRARGFNSIVVRLKVSHRATRRMSAVMFQFHSGSIKRESRQSCSPKPITCFNSIVVRLKGNSARGNRPVEKLFQFHSGSIKSFFVFTRRHSSLSFQFHSGSIKSRQKLVGFGNKS